MGALVQQCKKIIAEIARALQHNGRKDYFFALKQEWKTYIHLQKQIDKQIKRSKNKSRSIDFKSDWAKPYEFFHKKASVNG